jgi:ubiquinol-cytochrome c reductase cytochrome b subunit
MKFNELSPLPGQPNNRKVMFSMHLRKVLGFGIAAVGLLSFLAIIYPVGIFPGPYDGVELTKPPWVFLWLYGLENFFGIWSLIFVPGLLITGLVIIPIIDRRQDLSGWIRGIVVWGYLVTLALLLTLVIIVALTPSQTHIM